MLNEHSGILFSDGRDSTTIAISTLPGLLLHSAGQYRKPDAFKFKRNGQWINVSTDEFLLRVEELFFALRALGLKPGDRVVILSENRVEWAITDYAVLCSGATTVPIYPTLSAPQVAALLEDCQPAIVFVSCLALLQKVLSSRGAVQLPYIVAFDPDVYQPGVMQLDALYGIGRQSTYDYPGEFRRAALSVHPEQVATIIYTSGTTGAPKGAMLSHRNLVSNISATATILPLTSRDISLSFLPLSHIIQRHVDYALLRFGATTAYAQNFASIGDDMRDVKPTFAACVPRFFEKTYARVMDEVSRSSTAKRLVFESAIRAGRRTRPGWRASIEHALFERLVYRKVRARLGGRIRFLISGGAALSKEIAEFFHIIGIPILEGYGLTETSPVIALNALGTMRIGTVGRPVDGVEVQIASDGEVLVRGPNVMKGYYKKPRETQEALRDGWLHTGDIGSLDAEGFLTITDRKKDLIVMSNGKKVAPQPIENRLRLIPYFENVLIIGDHRNFISALVVPDYAALATFARHNGITFENPRELVHRRDVYNLLLQEIERRTSDLSNFEKIKKFAFVDSQFTLENEEMTPTMKIRRSVVQQKYRATIDKLYAA